MRNEFNPKGQNRNYRRNVALSIVLVSVVSIWVYRAIFGIGRVAYRSSLRGSRKVSKRAQARMKARRKARAKAGGVSTISGVPTPWGWHKASGQTHLDQEVRPSGSLIGHARSDEQVFANMPQRAAAKKYVGWPYKEEQMDFAGKSYKVSRKPTDRQELDGDGKP